MIRSLSSSSSSSPLLAGRLWSSFNNSLRLSRKASIIPRGLFGLATNTLKTWKAHILIFLLESYKRCRLVVTLLQIDRICTDIIFNNSCAEMENLSWKKSMLRKFASLYFSQMKPFKCIFTSELPDNCWNLWIRDKNVQDSIFFFF